MDPIQDHSELPLALRNALGSTQDIQLAKLPFVDGELLAHLETLFPPRQPLIDETIASVQRYAGIRDVVLYLRSLHDRQP